MSKQDVYQVVNSYNASYGCFVTVKDAQDYINRQSDAADLRIVDGEIY